MGLDLVELVMEVEDTFNIRFSEADYADIATVGDLHDYIVKRVNGTDDSVSEHDPICLTSATFLRIRRAFVSHFGLARHSVRPSSSVDEIVPRKERRKVWNQIQNVIELNLPPLRRPRWVVCTLLAIVSMLAAIFLWSLMPIDEIEFLGVALATVAAAAGLTVLTRPLATEPGPEFVTVGGLAHVVLQRNFRALHEQYNGWNPSDVWDTIQVILLEQLAIKPEEVTRDARFLEDLKMG